MSSDGISCFKSALAENGWVTGGDGACDATATWRSVPLLELEVGQRKVLEERMGAEGYPVHLLGLFVPVQRDWRAAWLSVFKSKSLSSVSVRQVKCRVLHLTSHSIGNSATRAGSKTEGGMTPGCLRSTSLW